MSKTVEILKRNNVDILFQIKHISGLQDSLDEIIRACNSLQLQIDNVNSKLIAATQNVNGLMSAADKLKLDNIQSGAQVNRNYPLASIEQNGLMTAADKKRLNQCYNHLFG